VIDQIKGFVIEKVVIAGITWIIGLLNPASAFIKACKAIYDIVMFFVERGSQIMALVNAVIDSVTAIAQGNIAGAANFVEQSLAKAVPVVISFLAALLGVGGISEKIKSVITQIQEPINQAIDWVIDKAIGLFKAAGKLLGFGGKDKAEDKHGPDSRGDAEKDADVGRALTRVDNLVKDNSKSTADIMAALPPIKEEHKLTTLDMKEVSAPGGTHDFAVEASIQRTTVTYRGVEIVDAKNAPVGEFDKITGGIFIEEKSAKGINTPHPLTGKPVQTPEQWAERQVFDKTVVRIEKLKTASATRPTKGGSPTVPPLGEIQNMRELHFHIEAATPEIQAAVLVHLQNLTAKYPDWKFAAMFGP